MEGHDLILPTSQIQVTLSLICQTYNFSSRIAGLLGHKPRADSDRTWVSDGGHIL